MVNRYHTYTYPYDTQYKRHWYNRILCIFCIVRSHQTFAQHFSIGSYRFLWCTICGTPNPNIYYIYIVYSLHFRSSTILFLFRIYYTCISLIFILYVFFFYFCRVCVIILFQLHFKWCTHLLGFNASSFNHTGMWFIKAIVYNYRKTLAYSFSYPGVLAIQ